jgi:hypothetical protein
MGKPCWPETGPARAGQAARTRQDLAHGSRIPEGRPGIGSLQTSWNLPNRAHCALHCAPWRRFRSTIRRRNAHGAGILPVSSPTGSWTKERPPITISSRGIVDCSVGLSGAARVETGSLSRLNKQVMNPARIGANAAERQESSATMNDLIADTRVRRSHARGGDVYPAARRSVQPVARIGRRFRPDRSSGRTAFARESGASQ